MWETESFKNIPEAVRDEEYKLLEQHFSEISKTDISPNNNNNNNNNSNNNNNNNNSSSELTPNQFKNKVVHILDPKRVNNISIMLSRLKCSHADLKKNILAMDEELIGGGEVLVQMVKFLPTAEELDLLRNVADEDKAFLGKPEQYFLEVKVFFLPSRTHVYTYMIAYVLIM